MSLYQRAPYQTADYQQVVDDASDQEEEAMVNSYREQAQHYNDGHELEQVNSQDGGQMQDMQQQLQQAAQPLEFQATMETKFASYDNYCSLFHYILNSDGPVDLEVPSVG
jgi:translation initiation factor 3 subunit L